MVDVGIGIFEVVCSIFFYEDGIGGIGRLIIFLGGKVVFEIIFKYCFY